jgi:hypothetical protein
MSPDALGQRLGCMVVGFDQLRRFRLAAAAATSGWDVVQCDQPATVPKQLLQQRQQLVIVDLEAQSGEQGQRLRQLADRIGRRKGLLLAVCGNEGRPLEEIWARRLGVWLYLPGVAPDEGFSELLKEGIQIAAWRWTSAHRERYFPKRYTASA